MVDEANAAIRRFVAGRGSWGPAELAELDRLRQTWTRAARGEKVTFLPVGGSSRRPVTPAA